MSEMIEAIEHLSTAIVVSGFIVFLGLILISIDLTLIRRILKNA